MAGPPSLLPVPDNPNPAANAPNKSAKLLCYVTDRISLPPQKEKSERRLAEKIRVGIDAGVDWVQVREKDLPTRELLVLVEEAVRTARARQVIVNDRLDVAVAGAAAGVHLGRESAPLREAVRWCRSGNAPRDFLIGASCHTLAEAREAEIAGASYLIFGPVFDTPSKRAFGRPLGIEELSRVCSTVKIRVLAIGGIDLRTARECFREGAAGIAAIRLFQDADNAREMKGIVDSLRDAGESES